MGSEIKHLSIENDTHTCERCSPINFVDLENTEPDSWQKLITMPDLSQPLTDPHCPTCQILQATTDVHCLQYTSANVFWGRASPNKDFMGTLFFRYSTGDTDRTLKPELTVYDDMAIPRPPRRQHPLKRVDFERAKTWIDACKESHPDCTARSPKVLRSLRLIDCVTRSVISAPGDCVYVALSYVWGISKACDGPSSSPLLDQLPLTVDNGIHATLMLGYRYLWVDKYCIDQANASDKHDQINQMGDIYGSAELTLIAAAGANSAYGLPGVGHDRDNAGDDVTVGRLRFVTTYDRDIDDIHFSVWSSRAWTFQEGFISRRRLYFTDTALFYICDPDKEAYCDVDSAFEPGHFYLSQLWGSFPRKRWHPSLANDILEHYTRRKLTYDSDALNGIVGVLNTLSKLEVPIFHTWGVTFGEVPLAVAPPPLNIALNWCHNAPCFRRKAFPSWSPLGWEGRVEYASGPSPEISRSFQVRVWVGNEYIDLSQVKQDLHQQIGAVGLENSRYLKVTARLSWLEVRYFSASKLLSIDKSSVAVDRLPWLVEPREGFHVRVPTGDNGEVYTSMLPRWDSEPDLSLDLIQVPCALIPRGDDARSIAAIMLRNHGTHYERIGYFAHPQEYMCRLNFLFKDNNGALTVEEVRKDLDSYSDEELARDFNNPEMQTFLLG